MNSRTMSAMALAVALVMPLIGCARMRIGAERMCSGAGGRYTAQTQMCDTPAQSRSAAEMCKGLGGYWDSTSRTCDMGGD